MGGYADIVFFAVVAGIILFRLYHTLGRHDNMDGQSGSSSHTGLTGQVIKMPVPPGVQEPAPASETHAASTPEDDLKHIEDAAVRKGLQAIAARDGQFQLSHFMQGAGAAFELVVEAFAKGEKETLKPLLAKDVYEGFCEAIDARQNAPEYQIATLIALETQDITEARLEGSDAIIGIDFTSRQMMSTLSAKEEASEAALPQPIDIQQHWVFRRNVRSSNPAWTIVAT